MCTQWLYLLHPCGQILNEEFPQVMKSLQLFGLRRREKSERAHMRMKMQETSLMHWTKWPTTVSSRPLRSCLACSLLSCIPLLTYFSISIPDTFFCIHYSNLCMFFECRTWARAVCGSSPGQWFWVSRAPPSSALAPTWSSGSDCRQKTKREKWAHVALIRCLKMCMYILLLQFSDEFLFGLQLVSQAAQLFLMSFSVVLNLLLNCSLYNHTFRVITWITVSR